MSLWFLSGAQHSPGPSDRSHPPCCELTYGKIHMVRNCDHWSTTSKEKDLSSATGHISEREVEPLCIGLSGTKWHFDGCLVENPEPPQGHLS